ncbi:MAG TPA: hypothetical protein VK586_03985 [Streptosporangiaceae bacterium]|nr:hypothetical protein [Streptosporangiaceae bacterium]
MRTTPFEELFRDAYQALLRDAIFAGGNPHEAEDAVSAALEEVLRRWDRIDNPRAYARKATISPDQEQGARAAADPGPDYPARRVPDRA